MTSWAYIEDRSMPEPNSGCLLWLGATTAGYGVARINGKNVLAHRLAYELKVGSVPQGLFVCHRCDVRCCVNPDHLFIGTNQDNMRDMSSKGRAGYGGTGLSVNQVRAVFNDSRKYKEIASDYNLSFSTISMIKTGAQWSRVTGQKYRKIVKTHCNMGHPWVPENIGIRREYEAVRNYCKICNRMRALENYYKRAK